MRNGYSRDIMDKVIKRNCLKWKMSQLYEMRIAKQNVFQSHTTVTPGTLRKCLGMGTTVVYKSNQALQKFLGIQNRRFRALLSLMILNWEKCLNKW